MGFDIENFIKPVACEFLPDGYKDGEGLQLELNLHLISIEFMEKLEAELNDTIQKAKQESETENKVIEGEEDAQISFFFQQKEELKFKARILGGEAGKKNDPNRIIKSWNLMRKGKPVPVSQNEIIKLGRATVDALFNFCMTAGQPKKTSAEP